MLIDLPVIETGLELGIIDLDNQKVIPNEKNSIWFDCQSNIDCCTTMRIPASSFDIDRIMEHGYELDQIIEEASPIILKSHSKFGPSQKAYILKTKPFDGSCTFLENKLCKIHEFKPFACKLYPFSLDFISDSRIRLLIHQDQLCEAIKAVHQSEAMNSKILQEKMEIILNEVQLRGFDLKTTKN